MICYYNLILGGVCGVDVYDAIYGVVIGIMSCGRGRCASESTEDEKRHENTYTNLSISVCILREESLLIGRNHHPVLSSSPRLEYFSTS